MKLKLPTTIIISAIVVTITTCSLNASSFMISSSTKIVSRIGIEKSTKSALPVFLRIRPIHVAFRPLTTVAASRTRSIIVSMNSREKLDEEPMEEGQRQGLLDIGRSTPTSTTTPSSSIVKEIWKTRIDISIAKSRKIRGSNYVQLSTVDGKTCEPRCRTVVFRGFVKGYISPSLGSENDVGSGGDLGGGCVMKMITDARSSKVNEVMYARANNAKEIGGENKEIRNTAEMVWWFPKSSEQYRVRGQLQFIGTDGPLGGDNINESYVEENHAVQEFLTEQRRQQWGNLSEMAREQFYWENPGEPFGEVPSAAVPAGGRDEDGKVLPPPDAFLLMLLYPKRVDYLRLSDNYHQIDELVMGDIGDETSCRWMARRANP